MQRIAVQLYSVRNEMECDFYGTLKKIKDMGYEGVEFAGLFEYSANEVKAMLSELGLTAVSAHVPYETLLSGGDDVMNEYKTLGCKYIVIPYLIESDRMGGENFEQVMTNIHKLGEKAKAHDLQLLYHNHDFEFIKIDGEYGLDKLYRLIPADLLATEIDTCWVNVAGEDPVSYVKQYAGRAPVVHLKDFVMPGKKPVHLYQLIGIESEQNEEADSFDFRPVGYGVQNIPAILKACDTAGTEWIVVEMDEPQKGKTPLEGIQKSIEYLLSL